MSASLARGMLHKMGGSCCPHHAPTTNPFRMAKLHGNNKSTDYAFEMVCSTLRFGKGVTLEIGYDVRNLGAKQTLLITDKNVQNTIAFKNAEQALKMVNIDYEVFDDVLIEPSEKSMQKAIAFAKSKPFDSFIAVGGGSVIDTTKAAALYASNPEADFLDFVGPPFGKSLQPKNPMLPLIAVPTTAGTGSETTAAAIMDLPEHKCKTGIRLRCIKPYLAVVDPLNVMSMPRNVAIYSGFDVLCHALESYTALPYDQRSPRPARPEVRPVYQGSNPISDVWSREALRIIGKYFRRSVFDPSDEEARTEMLKASSFAGIGFGNAGVHLCHGLSYPISSQAKGCVAHGYPQDKNLIPHGLSVMTTAVADFEFTTAACPDRHLVAAQTLGADIPNNADNEYISRTLCDQLRGFMKDFGVPNGLKGMGFEYSDIDHLTEAASHSVPNIVISPKSTDRDIISKLYEKSLTVY
ncbi:hypothetical protein B9Z55_006011 [Caenorhabditis nigoni]|uniref:Hydroxyacid-oxoacid transhydrogenase, mitochondrial n=1 Tax=Caenorhabditis nigoni TaxID=1611254 RepID=A0A2G5V390_9PELO|nr:hypothetical protein B9Z55_006011 [Caenorhabditis nigoni]